MVAVVPRLADLAQCDKCSLCGGNKPAKPVFGFGPREAELVIVGEAPLRSGTRPFVGNVGALLWDELRKLGMPYEDVYSTYLLGCPIPEGTNVRQKDLAACRERVLAELRALEGPRVILALGSNAATMLRGEKTNITQYTGRIVWSDTYHAFLSFSYNPAAVVRQPEMYNDFVWGLMTAVDALTLPEGPIEYPDIEYAVAGDWDVEDSAVERYLQDALDAPKVVCDLETTGLSPKMDAIRSIGVSWNDHFALILPMDYVEEHPAIRALLNLVLSQRPNAEVVGHNYQFDVRFLREAGFDAYVGGDTMLLHYVLDERSAKDGGGYHDLKRLAHKYCDAPDYADGIDREHMSVVPAAQMYRYQAYDCIYTFRLYDVLKHYVLKEPPSREYGRGPWDVYQKLLIPAANALADIEQRGLRIDGWKLLQLRKEYSARIEESRQRAETQAGTHLAVLNGKPFNPNSSLQVATLLYTPESEGGFGYTPPKAQKRGAKTKRPTDETAIHALQRYDKALGRPANPLLDTILDYRSLLHTKSTYLDGILERMVKANGDGCLRSHFHLPGTTSGRLSSSDPNFQNIPARSVIKELFVPRPGHVLVNADYRRLEVGILAWYSGDTQLIRDFQAEDFHWNVAQKVFGEIVGRMNAAAEDVAALTQIANDYAVFTEMAQRQARSTERINDPHELYDKLKELLRRQAKYISFGKMYGEGAVSLADPEKGMGVPVEVAARYSRIWDDTYPVAVEFLRDQVYQAKTFGWLETPIGRRRRFQYPQHLAQRLANEAMNFPIQSFASDLCLISLVKLNRLLPARGLGNVLLTVHDSILFELVEEKLEEAMALVHEVMTSIVPDERIVFEIDMKVGPNWGKAA